MNYSLTAVVHAATQIPKIPILACILKSVLFMPEMEHFSTNGERAHLKMSMPPHINNFYSLECHENSQYFIIFYHFIIFLL